MYRLELLSLTCNKGEDGGTKNDEPRMTVNGAWVYGPGKMSDGETANLEGRSRTFISNALIRLADQDNPGDEDLIGTYTVIGANEVNLGEQLITLGGADGEYDLQYYVVLA